MVKANVRTLAERIVNEFVTVDHDKMDAEEFSTLLIETVIKTVDERGWKAASEDIDSIVESAKRTSSW